MAKIKKRRARTFCAAGPAGMGFYPRGVGGLESYPVIIISIGDHTVYLTKEEFDKIASYVKDMMKLVS